MPKIKYLPYGIVLHLKEIYYKITDNLNEYYYFHFEDIGTGIKVSKILKNENIKSIPVPNEIYEKCGVAILTKEKDKIKNILKQKNIHFEIWIYDNEFKKIEENKS
ncbi:MAG TPA: DUF3343 domain-containing protein [Nautiliaceae bacterium]|nr:DUF3343 domain-containing protein [Nautiliaceae bacterium]